MKIHWIQNWHATRSQNTMHGSFIAQLRDNIRVLTFYLKLITYSTVLASENIPLQNGCEVMLKIWSVLSSDVWKLQEIGTVLISKRTDGFHSLTTSAKVPLKQVESFLKKCTTAPTDGRSVGKSLSRKGKWKWKSLLFYFKLMKNWWFIKIIHLLIRQKMLLPFGII